MFDCAEDCVADLDGGIGRKLSEDMSGIVGCLFSTGDISSLRNGELDVYEGSVVCVV